MDEYDPATKKLASVVYVEFPHGDVPESWKAKRMAPRARSVHPLKPMKDLERSDAMVDQMAGHPPDASARAVKARRARILPNMFSKSAETLETMLEFSRQTMVSIYTLRESVEV